MDMFEIELAMTVCRNGFVQPCVVVGLNRNTEEVVILPLPSGWSPTQFLQFFNREKMAVHADSYKFPEHEKAVLAVYTKPRELGVYDGPH